MIWIIGRKGAINVDSPTVSGEHARLTKRPDGTFLLEDLNSTNGTFVNGQRIVSKVITQTDRVELSGTIRIDLFAAITPTAPPPTAPPPTNEVDPKLIAEFEKLKKVYAKYSQDKVEMQQHTITKTMLKRSLPMAIPAVIGVAILFFESWGKFAAIGGAVLSLIGIVWGIQSSSKEQAELPQKMQELEDRFRVDYVCPKCKNFLGQLPWEGLRNRGACSFCKSKWL